MDELRPSPRLDFRSDLSPVHDLRLSTSGMLAQLAAVRAGLSIGVLAHYMTRGTGLVAILPKEALWKHTFWLATNADWYRLSRVRAVWDFVRSAVEAEVDFFLPPTTRSRKPVTARNGSVERQSMRRTEGANSARGSRR
jgi:DNA-binding transcriptional LysR family regulator